MEANARGFTVVEVMVASALTVVLMLAVFGTTEVMTKSVNTGDRAQEALDAAHGALQRVSQIVRQADSATVRVRNGVGTSWYVPTAGTSYPSLRFADSTGATIRFEFVRDPSELANSADDDGDGLVDEGSLTIDYSSIPGGRMPIASGVEQCAFTLDGRLLQLTLRCVRRDQQRRLHAVVRTVKVHLRNG